MPPFGSNSKNALNDIKDSSSISAQIEELIKLALNTDDNNQASTSSTTTFSSNTNNPLFVGLLIDYAKIDNTLKKLLREFLYDSDSKLFCDKLNRAEVVSDLLNILENPNKINQGNTSLCGIATFIYILAKEKPETLLKMALELAKHGEVKQPIPITVNSDLKNLSEIMPLLMASIRDSFNRILRYPPRPTSTSSEELSLSGIEVAAITRPNDFARFFKPLKVKVHDMSIIPLPKSRLKRTLLGKIHADKHTHYNDKRENLDKLIEKMNSSAKQSIRHAILLLKPSFVDDDNKSYLFSIPKLHWVNLISIKKAETSTSSNVRITLEYATYGEKHEKTVGLEKFLEDYQGAVLVKFNNQRLNKSPSTQHPQEPKLFIKGTV